MNTDHATMEQATYGLFKSWKEAETVKLLGEQQLCQLDFNELLVLCGRVAACTRT
jgi:hypothetical protein